MKTFVYIAASLDGYIARADGSLDWLTSIPNPDKSDFGFAEFMNTIDAVVMGRNTFETVVTFKKWPYSKRVFVLSNSLQKIPDSLNSFAELLQGNPIQILGTLGKRGYQNVYVDGGKTIQYFLGQDLIDELIITRIPILLGNGIPLFSTMKMELAFEHVKTEVYLKALVKSHYARKRK